MAPLQKISITAISLFFIFLNSIVCEANTYHADGSTIWSEIKGKIDGRLAETFSGPTSPGYSLSVIHNGQIVLKTAHGHASPEFGIAFSPNTPTPIASITKSILAGAFAELERQGRVHLDDPVSQYWPEWPAIAQSASIRSILSMSAGLVQDEKAASLFGSPEAMSKEDLIDFALSRDELIYPIDRMAYYSDLNYRVAARLLELITGQSFEAAMRTLVFTPAGMSQTRNTSHYVFALQKGEAPPYTDMFASGKWPLKRGRPYEHFGDGSVVTSLTGLTSWVLHILADHPEGSLFDRMTTPQQWENGVSRWYHLGLRRATLFGAETEAWCHGGANGSYFCIFPEQDLAIITVTNWRPDDYDLVIDRYTDLANVVLNQAAPRTPTEDGEIAATRSGNDGESTRSGFYVSSAPPYAFLLNEDDEARLKIRYTGYEATLVANATGDLIPVFSERGPNWLRIKMRQNDKIAHVNPFGLETKWRRADESGKAASAESLKGFYWLDSYDLLVKAETDGETLRLRFGNGLVDDGVMAFEHVIENVWREQDDGPEASLLIKVRSGDGRPLLEVFAPYIGRLHLTPTSPPVEGNVR